MQVMWDCLDIKNVGVGSLTNHMKYKKHQLKESGMSTATVSFFAATSVPGTSSTAKPSSFKRTMAEDFVVSANVLNAEIKWSLKVVMSYFSFRSCERIGNLFAVFTVSCDESLNKVLQNEQMDIQVRFLDENSFQSKTSISTPSFC